MKLEVGAAMPLLSSAAASRASAAMGIPRVDLRNQRMGEQKQTIAEATSFSTSASGRSLAADGPLGRSTLGYDVV